MEIREQVSKASDFFARKVGELALAVQAAEVFPPAAETDVPALLQEIADLRRFAYLNYLAVVKAVKKRNRHLELAFGEAACEMQAATLLLPQAFFSSPLLSNLATRLEVRSLKPAASQWSHRPHYTAYQLNFTECFAPSGALFAFVTWTPLCLPFSCHWHIAVPGIVQLLM